MPVAVVTGSNKGIGFGIVRALCKKFEGDVFLTSRDEGRGRAAVEDLEKEGLKPKYHVLDIGDKKLHMVHSPEVEMGQFFLSNILDENGQVPSDIPSDTKNSIRVVH